MKILIFSLVLFPLLAQAQVIDLSYKDTLCLNETLVPSNNSTGFLTYEWDFCTGDLSTIPNGNIISTNSNFNTVFSIDVVKKDIWRAFIPSRNGNKIIRADFNIGLKTSPAFTDLGDFGGLLDGPTSISIIDSADYSFGFTCNLDNGNIIRFDFQENISNTPSPLNLGNFGAISNPDGIKVISDTISSYKIIVLYGTKVGIVDLGPNVSSSGIFSSFTIPLSNRLWAIDLIYYDENWIGVASSFSNGKVFHINFGSKVTNSAVVTELPTGGLTFGSPADIKWIKDGPRFYVIFQARSGKLFKYNFADNPASTTPSVEDLGNLGFLVNNSSGLDFVKDSSEWIGIGTNFTNNTLHWINFEKECNQELVFSTLPEPSLQFQNAGDFPFTFTAFNDSSSNHLHDTIHVKIDEAPTIDFTIDSNRCVVNENQFSASGDLLDIASFQWIFGSDTLETSQTASDTTYQFPSPGTYSIGLIVNSFSGCTNYVQKEITMFGEPPTPDFITDGTLCSGTTIDFINTTNEAGFEGSLNYLWDFNGEGSSSDENPSFIFNSNGVKQIQFTISIPGCSSFVSTSIELEVGPAVDFDWMGNCFGDSIQFNNKTTGTDITGYQWDFGDGQNSTAENPKHFFTFGGEYNVTLVANNVAGCESSITKELTINDQPLADFSWSPFTKNVQGTLSGIDLTLAYEEVIDWLWEINGESYTGQSIQVLFDEADTFNVELVVQTDGGCSDTISNDIIVRDVVFPELNITTSKDTFCLDEGIELNNQSVNVDYFEWDFCTKDFDKQPSSTLISTSLGLDQPFAIEMVRDNNNWYGFVLSRGSNEIIRYDFGDSPMNEINGETILNNITGLIDGPVAISFLKESGNWFGFVASLDSSKIYRLDFHENIENEPDIKVLNLSGITSPDGIEVFETSEGYKGLVLAGNKIHILDFDSINGDPNRTEVTVTGASRLWGIDVKYDGSEWYGLLSGFGSNQLFHISFGSTISSAMTINPIDPGGLNFNSPTDLSLVNADGKYYGFVNKRQGTMLKLDFGSFVSNAAPSVSEISELNIGSNISGLKMIKEKGKWLGFITNFFQNTLSRLVFEDTCSVNKSFSDKYQPDIFSYFEAGSYVIELTGFIEGGNSGYVYDTIQITPSTAPDIAFSISSNQCLSNTNTLTSSNTSGNITTYSWDFDGDGIEDSADPNPTYQFAEAGTYEVRLTVESDEGCGNFAQESITIYSEPPVPVFTVPKDSFCVGEPVVISNLTDDAAWDGIVEYAWSVTDLTDTTTAAPELTFAQPGEKIIRVISQIPGCESVEVTDTIQVIESPLVDFTADPVCDGETTIFSNTSEAGTILWDFGDGNTSTQVNPSHTYATPDTYSVSLSVTNDLECTTTLVKEVAVNAIPQANFQYDLVCEGSESAFEDMSVVDQADITSWQWLVDGEPESEEQFPLITFPVAGDYTVGLIAGSSKGCESYYEEVVTVGESPDASIGIDLGCIGEPTLFTDLTDPSNVLTRSWMIDGQPYDDETPSVTFNGSGDFEVQLTVTNNQLCSSIVTETFTVHELPVPDFNIEGQCNNEVIVLEDASTPTSDPITFLQWYIDGNLIGEGTSASISGYLPGTYDFTLEVTTENGCVLTSAQSYEIVETPVASFTASNDYGVPPFQLEFNNTSQMATVNEWYVNDALITTNPSPSIIFNDSGSQQVRLITYNSTGCADTAELVVNAIEPVVDLALTDIQLVEDGDNYEIVLDVKNSSNLPIEAMNVNVELQNQFSVSEQVYQRINAGEESIVMLGTSIPKSTHGPAYLCISISSAYDEDTANLSDNEACITIEPKISFEPPYPNPATTETSLRYILPEGGNASIEVYDVAGNLEILKDYEDLPTGLNQFILNVTNLDAGTYLVKFRYKESVIVSKIIKL